MTWLTSNAGGSVAPPQHAEYFFEHLYAQSVGLSSGFRRVNTSRQQLEVPRLLADGTANWTAEGDEITTSDPNADTLVAEPRKLAALSYQSNELIADSNPSSQDMVAESLARAISLKLDLGFFEGSGTAPEIRGLKNQTGIQTLDMGTDGAAITNLDPFADALGMLSGVNARAGAIVMHPRTWRTITKLKETDTSNKPLITDGAGSPTESVSRSIYGVPVLLTSQLSTSETHGTATDATSVYVYEPRQVVAVMREGATIDTDTSARFSRDQTAIRVTMRADMVLPNPEAVVRIAGITPAA